jgi:hypothetical protein
MKRSDRTLGLVIGIGGSASMLIEASEGADGEGYPAENNERKVTWISQ